MSVPDYLDIVERVDRRHPNLLRYNTHAADAEFLQRVLLELPSSEAWGHVGKSPGENGYTFPNGVRVSHDAIFSRHYNRQVDVIHGSGAHPQRAGPAWQEIDPAVYRPSNVWTPQQPLFDSGTPAIVDAERARLGRGWFCMLRAMQDWRDEWLSNWDWILRHENPDFFRVFLNVEGLAHTGSIGIDVWRDAGVDPRLPWWEARFKEMLDVFGSHGKQGWLTLHGGRFYMPTSDDRRHFNDAIVTCCEGRWNAVLGFEIANEYRVNRWNDAEVQAMGRDLRAKAPSGTLIALSAPHREGDTKEDMLAAMQRLYGAPDFGGASIMTIHRDRDERSTWRDPFSYNGLMPELQKVDNEPSGQGASAGGDVRDVEKLVRSYQRVSEAGWPMHVAHNAWSVWNGHMPEEWLHELERRHGHDLHRKRFMWEMPNQTAVSVALNDYRQTGIVVIPEPVPVPGGGDDMPLPDRGRVMRFLEWLHEYYKSPEGLQRPDGLWIGDHPDFEGISAWQEVFWQQTQSGKTDEEARAEVIRQIEASDEWQRKHEGQRRVFSM